jgi:D-alanyl-D-alanine dipeptidase
MPRSFGEPLTKLRAVPIQDNGEPLIDPRTLSKRIRFAEKHPKFEGMPRTPNVRKSVAERLAQAADSLPGGIGIEIIEGFRPLHQQRFMYEEIRKGFAARHPEWSKATLNRVTNTMSAPPEDKCPPPHSTGAAVDLCLVVAGSGERLDMVSPYEWDDSSAPTVMKGLSPEAQKNRQLLIDTLTATGLTNYAGEWWHWSYGDSGWALRAGADHAVYDRLPEADGK